MAGEEGAARGFLAAAASQNRRAAKSFTAGNTGTPGAVYGLVPWDLAGQRSQSAPPRRRRGEQEEEDGG